MIINYNEIEYDCNDEFSFKDFTGRVDVIPSGIIYASSFSQEDPDRHIFPDDMKGVVFIKCNLMNVFIPKGNVIIDCLQQRFKVQNDRNDWILNPDNTPKEPINAKIFIKLGLPIPDPKDIPIAEAKEAIDLIVAAKEKLTLEIK